MHRFPFSKLLEDTCSAFGLICAFSFFMSIPFFMVYGKTVLWVSCSRYNAHASPHAQQLACRASVAMVTTVAVLYVSRLRQGTISRLHLANRTPYA